MLTDIRISSILVPAAVWRAGSTTCRGLPPLSMPAKDALDIERRAGKDVNLRNELRRYTLCCERMQSIALDLLAAGAMPHAPVTWHGVEPLAGSAGSARAWLAVAETLDRRVVSNPGGVKLYDRIARSFFPPEHARAHHALVQSILAGTALDKLFARAAKTATLLHAPITVEDCRRATEARLALLQAAAKGEQGLIDVVEIA